MTTAAITLPPRDYNTKRYLQLMQRRVQKMKTDLAAAEKEVKDVLAAGERVEEGFAENIRYGIFRSVDLESFQQYTETLNDDVNDLLKWLDDCLHTYSLPNLTPYYTRRSIAHLIQMAQMRMARGRPQSALRQLELDAENDAKRMDDAAEYWPEFEAQLKQLTGIIRDRLPAIHQQVVAAYEEIVARLSELLQHLSYDAGGRESRYRPGKGVEKLYHATAWKTEIARDGFRAEKPGGRMGLGGGVDLICFTADLYIAKEIARCLKEAVMIVNGQLTERELMEWLRADGISRERWESGYGPKSDIGKYGPNGSVRDITDYTMSLYKAWLGLNESMRSNPVFFGTPAQFVDALKGRKVADVGVLECMVDVDAEHVEFVPAEMEFRAPASAVQSVRVLW